MTDCRKTYPPRSGSKDSLDSGSSSDLEVVFDHFEKKKNKIYQVVKVASDDEKEDIVTYERAYANGSSRKIVSMSEAEEKIRSDEHRLRKEKGNMPMKNIAAGTLVDLGSLEDSVVVIDGINKSKKGPSSKTESTRKGTRNGQNKYGESPVEPDFLDEDDNVVVIDTDDGARERRSSKKDKRRNGKENCLNKSRTKALLVEPGSLDDSVVVLEAGDEVQEIRRSEKDKRRNGKENLVKKDRAKESLVEPCPLYDNVVVLDADNYVKTRQRREKNKRGKGRENALKRNTVKESLIQVQSGSLDVIVIDADNDANEMHWREENKRRKGNENKLQKDNERQQSEENKRRKGKGNKPNKNIAKVLPIEPCPSDVLLIDADTEIRQRRVKNKRGKRQGHIPNLVRAKDELVEPGSLDDSVVVIGVDNDAEERPRKEKKEKRAKGKESVSNIDSTKESLFDDIGSLENSVVVIGASDYVSLPNLKSKYGLIYLRPYNWGIMTESSDSVSFTEPSSPESSSYLINESQVFDIVEEASKCAADCLRWLRNFSFDEDGEM